MKILNARAIAGDNNEPLLTKLITKMFSINDNSGNGMVDEFYGLANIHCYGLCDALRSEFSELSRKEITICGMLAMGFDLTTICMLAGYDNVTSYYNKRSMIRRTMGLDSSTGLEEFLSSKVAGLEEKDRLRYINLINSL